MTRASDDGISEAAPAAWSTRKPIKVSAVGATPHAIEAAVKAADPARNTRRCPTRSASLPAGMSNAAKTMVYALRTHDSVDGLDDEKVRVMSGNAT